MSYAVSRRSLFGGISILSLGALPLTARAQTPATAPGAPPAVEVFAAPAFVDQVALSPDGKTVALVTQRGDDKLLFYMNLADRKPQFQNMGKEKIRGLAWGDNTHILVISSSTMTLPLQFDKQELFFNNLTQVLTITNAGQATMKGAEVEVAWRPTAWLGLTATYGYLDTRYDEFVIPGGAVYTGNALGSSPKVIQRKFRE